MTDYEVSESAGSVVVCVELTSLPSGGLESPIDVELSVTYEGKSF